MLTYADVWQAGTPYRFTFNKASKTVNVLALSSFSLGAQFFLPQFFFLASEKLFASFSLGTQFSSLYSYKSTNTDAEGAATLALVQTKFTQLVSEFTCFTSTKVQILTRF